MKKLLIIYLLIISVKTTLAQQDAMFTHYMFNTLSINPAYAGSRDALTVTGLHRSMWVGFEGAPITQTITLHTPIINDQLGLGVSILNDKIGPSNQTTFSLDLAYDFSLNKKFKLAFGLKSTLGLRSIKLTELDLETKGDNAFSEDISNEIDKNLGAGLYLYSENFYMGASSPALMEGSLYDSEVLSSLGSYQRHMFFTMGGVIKLNESIKFKPTSLVKITEQAPIELDLTASFLFNDKFWMGAMYRTGDAAGVLLGYYITEQLAVGYSFDWSYANTTFKYNGGSHELMIRYDFIYHNQKQIISPRYF
tara:strand:+ start:566 stop:1489 length:924 start_codon:yes stop_codon:yes gene_type:complete